MGLFAARKPEHDHSMASLQIAKLLHVCVLEAVEEAEAMQAKDGEPPYLGKLLYTPVVEELVIQVLDAREKNKPKLEQRYLNCLDQIIMQPGQDLFYLMVILGYFLNSKFGESIQSYSDREEENLMAVAQAHPDIAPLILEPIYVNGPIRADFAVSVDAALGNTDWGKRGALNGSFDWL